MAMSVPSWREKRVVNSHIAATITPTAVQGSMLLMLLTSPGVVSCFKLTGTAVSAREIERLGILMDGMSDCSEGESRAGMAETNLPERGLYGHVEQEWTHRHALNLEFARISNQLPEFSYMSRHKRNLASCEWQD
jgi:hypothetical protein